jgi:hypothetical protein
MRNYTSIGLSVTTETAKKIDSERGEISWSLFLRKIIEKGLLLEAAVQQNENKAAGRF